MAVNFERYRRITMPHTKTIGGKSVSSYVDKSFLEIEI